MSLNPNVHHVDGGEATMPSHIFVEMFDTNYPVQHAGAVWAGPNNANTAVILALGHPIHPFGFYMGLSAEQARQVAGWLVSAADAVDGVEGAAS